MKELIVGQMVIVGGKCRCQERPSLDDFTFYDIKDCFHKLNKVRHLFQDGISAWLVNRYGYGKRVKFDAFVGGGTYE